MVSPKLGSLEDSILSPGLSGLPSAMVREKVFTVHGYRIVTRTKRYLGLLI